MVVVGRPSIPSGTGKAVFPDVSALSGAGVVGDDPGSGDPPDAVVAIVGEPQGPVGSGPDRFRVVDAGAGVVGDDAGGGDPPDGVVAIDW